MLARQPVGFVISLARGDSSRDRESAVRKIRAGASASKITPPVGGDLAGYARREGPSVGVHDDLWCRTLVLDDGDTRLALVALDLLSVDFEVAALLHGAVAGAVGTAPDHVLVNCTHTHAAPGPPSGRGTGTPGTWLRSPSGPPRPPRLPPSGSRLPP
jgi:predicted neutral ceramidase superfamily lipid hydrolase